MLLKVCGLKYGDNVKEVIALQPSYVGFIFYRKSKRYVGDNFLAEVTLKIPKVVNKVGVFVDEELEEVLSKVDAYKLDFVQLHGNESPAYCRKISQEVHTIKAFGIDDDFDFKSVNAYKPHCKFFLFDTKSSLHGGSGQRFNWNVLKSYDNEKPFFISGGIGLETIPDMQQLANFNVHAIDVNSQFETEPGLKDITKLRLFGDQIKNLK